MSAVKAVTNCTENKVGFSGKMFWSLEYKYYQEVFKILKVDFTRKLSEYYKFYHLYY